MIDKEILVEQELEGGNLSRDRQSSPEKMVTDGRVTMFGAFKEPFRKVNLLDLDMRIGSFRMPRFVKNLRLKEWQHFGIISKDYYVGTVIFDAKFMGVSFFYVFSRKAGIFFEHSRTLIGGPILVSNNILDGKSYFRHVGYRLEFENHLSKGYHRINAKISAYRGKPKISADIRVLEDLFQVEPLIVVNPISENRPMYTHKAVCPVEGRIETGGETIELSPEHDFCAIDIQKTYYPYRTFWYWATFAFRDSKGRLIGMNACEGLIEDDENFNENCSWVDGKINLLGAVRFSFEKGNVISPWRVTSLDGNMDLEFFPQGERKGRINLGIVMSDFHQPFGVFRGRLPGLSGEEIEVENAFGLCEYHVARF